MLKRTEVTTIVSVGRARVDSITRMRGVSAERPTPYTNTTRRDGPSGRRASLAFIPWAGASYSELTCLRDVGCGPHDEGAE